MRGRKKTKRRKGRVMEARKEGEKERKKHGGRCKIWMDTKWGKKAKREKKRKVGKKSSRMGALKRKLNHLLLFPVFLVLLPPYSIQSLSCYVVQQSAKAIPPK